MTARPEYQGVSEMSDQHPITEDWLASVGFKCRDPGERQTFKHWTLRFLEPTDYGLYIETTMPGWITDKGEHIGRDQGWFLWVGRGSQFMHVRHVYDQSEINSLVEAMAGQPWVPNKSGNVPVRKRRVD